MVLSYVFVKFVGKAECQTVIFEALFEVPQNNPGALCRFPLCLPTNLPLGSRTPSPFNNFNTLGTGEHLDLVKMDGVSVTGGGGLFLRQGFSGSISVPARTHGRETPPPVGTSPRWPPPCRRPAGPPSHAAGRGTVGGVPLPRCPVRRADGALALRVPAGDARHARQGPAAG